MRNGHSAAPHPAAAAAGAPHTRTQLHAGAGRSHARHARSEHAQTPAASVLRSSWRLQVAIAYENVGNLKSRVRRRGVARRPAVLQPVVAAAGPARARVRRYVCLSRWSRARHALILLRGWRPRSACELWPVVARRGADCCCGVRRRRPRARGGCARAVLRACVRAGGRALIRGARAPRGRKSMCETSMESVCAAAAAH